MKMVTPLMGVAAIQVASDDVIPHRGMLQRDLVEFTSNRYKFNIKPEIPVGIPAAAIPLLQFQSGELVADGGKIPIVHIVILPDGYVVAARDTDLADSVMDDYLHSLDEGLGYRFATTHPERRYLSQIVAELDDKFVEGTAAFSVIQTVLNSDLGRENGNYKLKRLWFSYDSSADGPSLPSVKHWISPDFIIERRAGEPMERNRFFCGAPLRLSDHLRLLERVESEVKRTI
jgi:hypothetical protein